LGKRAIVQGGVGERIGGFLDRIRGTQKCRGEGRHKKTWKMKRKKANFDAKIRGKKCECDLNNPNKKKVPGKSQGKRLTHGLKGTKKSPINNENWWEPERKQEDRTRAPHQRVGGGGCRKKNTPRMKQPIIRHLLEKKKRNGWAGQKKKDFELSGRAGNRRGERFQTDVW